LGSSHHYAVTERVVTVELGTRWKLNTAATVLVDSDHRGRAWRLRLISMMIINDRSSWSGTAALDPRWGHRMMRLGCDVDWLSMDDPHRLRRSDLTSPLAEGSGRATEWPVASGHHSEGAARANPASMLARKRSIMALTWSGTSRWWK
jgi:hypothetical protein